ncbi:MAG: transposase [Candidatus Vogelbacteria bacterium]|nr:transposase [Candidatus Vogelbacteria bacterium]
MIRPITFCAGEYYHIYHRGNLKQPIFFDDSDRWRFITLLMLLQSLEEIPNLHAIVPEFKKLVIQGNLDSPNASQQLRGLLLSVRENTKANLINLTLMPNHFHLTLGAQTDNAISRYMQRALNSHTKYMNAKYERTGHLFQGPFGAKHVSSNDQLLHLSCYIHRNQHELPEWRGKEKEYPWSTYKDYCGTNRWGHLLQNKIILDQFDSPKDYEMHLEDSAAKLSEDEWLEL